MISNKVNDDAVIPLGWTKASIPSLSTQLRGVSYKKYQIIGNSVQNACLILRGGNIQDGKIVDQKDNVYVDLELVKGYQKLRQGDVVIVSSTGSVKVLGKAAQVLEDKEFVSFGAFLTTLRPSELMDWKYFGYFFQGLTYRNTIRKLGAGVNINNIKKQHFASIEIPLPPLPEQHRIVAKLDALMARHRRSQQLLEDFPRKLQQFRQSILARAVSGELTKDWRERNGEVESAVVGHYDPSLPATWKRGIIGEIGEVKGGKRLPKGEELVKENTGFPYIRARDLKRGTVLTENLLFLNPETQIKIKRYIVATGDVYITIVGAKIGDAGIIPVNMNGANLTENAAKITNLNSVTGEYLSSWIRSSTCQRFIKNSIMSAAQGKLALSRIKELPIHIPPIEEQKEIVKRVQALFSLADRLAAKYDQLKARFDQFPQALLAKAFRGELVPQDPSDEPADELLKRVLREGT